MTSKPELVVFDMDGVLVDVHSSWAWVHEHFGTNNEDSLKAFMDGKIDDLDFMKKDIKLWKRTNRYISRDDIVEILKDVPLIDGFQNCIPVLSERYETAIISGGLKPLAEYIGKSYFDMIMANDLKEKNGRLTGEGILEVELKNKGKAFDRLLSEMNFEEKETVAIGNSHIDAPMLKKAGTGIAFNPADKKVKEASDIIIEEKDLSLLLDFL
ncbi:MAG: HAD-IB family phosphatase [Candidatus Thermoplasmatota archaeon]|nr:HAD-IB family phosphatase [Candidatus Thermoplasmatota archaeon]MBS3789314.1 HAD-IB family phosphatase [Candidatus Thermoplasmatota archaeon]